MLNATLALQKHNAANNKKVKDGDLQVAVLILFDVHRAWQAAVITLYENKRSGDCGCHIKVASNDITLIGNARGNNFSTAIANTFSNVGISFEPPLVSEHVPGNSPNRHYSVEQIFDSLLKPLQIERGAAIRVGPKPVYDIG